MVHQIWLQESEVAEFMAHADPRLSHRSRTEYLYPDKETKRRNVKEQFAGSQLGYTTGALAPTGLW